MRFFAILFRVKGWGVMLLKFTAVVCNHRLTKIDRMKSHCNVWITCPCRYKLFISIPAPGIPGVNSHKVELERLEEAKFIIIMNIQVNQTA